MNAIQRATDFSEKRMLTESEGFMYCGQGRTAFRKWAAEIGARRKFGKAVRYDKRVLDAALDAMNPDV